MALLVTWGAAACGGSHSPATAGGATATTPVVVTGTPSPSPTPTGLSTAAYQQALTALDKALAPDFYFVAVAGTPDDLSNAFQKASSDLAGQREALEMLDPPTAAVAAHRQLIAALQTLGGDLDHLQTEAADAELCTGSSGARRASAGNGAHVMRLAAAAIAAADPVNRYRVGTFLPTGEPDETRQPDNGDLAPGRRGGYGQLTVSASSEDAVVKLTQNGGIVRDIFIRGGTSTTVTSIPDGTFDVYFTAGVDWDGLAGRFTRSCTYNKFDNPVTFTTRYLSTSVEYTTYRLTLYSTLGGTARSSEVPPKSFPTS
jgi:hypothetical protein